MLSPPVKPVEEPGSAPTKVGAKGGKITAGAKGLKEGAAPEPELSQMPGDPMKLLTPELASRLNPLIIVPMRANCLPDTPATTSQLDVKCEPVKLRMCWPAQVGTNALDLEPMYGVHVYTCVFTMSGTNVLSSLLCDLCVRLTSAEHLQGTSTKSNLTLLCIFLPSTVPFAGLSAFLPGIHTASTYPIGLCFHPFTAPPWRTAGQTQPLVSSPACKQTRACHASALRRLWPGPRAFSWRILGATWRYTLLLLFSYVSTEVLLGLCSQEMTVLLQYFMFAHSSRQNVCCFQPYYFCSKSKVAVCPSPVIIYFTALLAPSLPSPLKAVAR